MSALGLIKTSYYRMKSKLSWFFLFFIRSPLVEIYMQRMNKLNSRFYKNVQRDKRKNTDNFLKDYTYRSIPKILWIYWDKGEDKAPFIVKKCIDSWRVKNPSWVLNIINNDNLNTYVDLKDIPSHLSIQKKSDLIRFKILYKYGGVWADSTTYCHQPLDLWLNILNSNGFFLFRDGGPDRIIESWFIASSKAHPLIMMWDDITTKYMQKVKKSPSFYFWTFYLFQWGLKRDKNYLDEFKKCCSYPAPLCFKLLSYMEGRTDFDDFLVHFKNGLPLSKLNWRLDKSDGQIGEILNRIELLSEHN